MDGIGIYDLQDNGLSFDLVDLLRALGPAAESAWWRAGTPVWYLATDDLTIPALEASTVGGMWTRGSDLIALASQLHQVVDGVIEGVLSPTPPLGSGVTPWIVLRAVDSSWWEAYSEDVQALGKLRDRFHDVRTARYTPDHPATNYGTDPSLETAPENGLEQQPRRITASVLVTYEGIGGDLDEVGRWVSREGWEPGMEENLHELDRLVQQAAMVHRKLADPTFANRIRAAIRASSATPEVEARIWALAGSAPA